jgi:hypothetical protein
MRRFEGDFLAQGNEHVVFKNDEGVLKVPRPWRQMMGANVKDLLRGLELLNGHDVAYVPTEVLDEPVCVETPQGSWHFPYGMTQPMVTMHTLRESHLRDGADLREQMIRLLGISGQLQREHAIAIDFTGLDALKEFAPAWFYGRSLDLGMPNLIVQDRKAVLADVGLFHLNHGAVGFFQRPLAHAQNDLIRRVLQAHMPLAEHGRLAGLTPATPAYICVAATLAFDASRKLVPQKD